MIINNPVAKEGKSANCYIAGREGEYHFPAYKGAYNDLTDAALCEGDENSEVVVLASDNSSIQFSGLKYDPEELYIDKNNPAKQWASFSLSTELLKFE